MSDDNLVCCVEECTVYRRGAAKVGPFGKVPPVDLTFRLAEDHDGGFAFGDVTRPRARAWLTAVLEEAGVVLGDYDRDVVGTIAEDSISAVQVVAGWIARTRDLQGAQDDEGAQDVQGVQGDERRDSRTA